eukprot:360142-Chlamydomonas_euryale.AAC.3
MSVHLHGHAGACASASAPATRAITATRAAAPRNEARSGAACACARRRRATRTACKPGGNVHSVQRPTERLVITSLVSPLLAARSRARLTHPRAARRSHGHQPAVHRAGGVHRCGCDATHRGRGGVEAGAAAFGCSELVAARARCDRRWRRRRRLRRRRRPVCGGCRRARWAPVAADGACAA